MRRTILLLATMALAVLVGGGIAQAIINGEEDVGKDAHPYVGALVTDRSPLRETNGENLPLCSGTLISPTVFLTAGHCTDYLRAEGAPTYVSFDQKFDQNSELIPGTPYVHPNYCEDCGPTGFLAYDVGVVVLDKPVRMKTYGVLPPARLADTLDNGQLLTVVGYGVSDYNIGGGPQQPVFLDTRQRATVAFTNTDNVQGELFIMARDASSGQAGEGICYGDSGGPYFLPDQRTVVATVSWGNSLLCVGEDYGHRIDLPGQAPTFL